ncbi:hypothetical protein [Pedosphaera parvula]|uniref:hypothetical protein n=1 Tax=Pedosphaera parvula TaxID=1032527 RepID=UPI00135F169A|nr:hypothetical protein [Pedosphaera parvula]
MKTKVAAYRVGICSAVRWTTRVTGVGSQPITVWREPMMGKSRYLGLTRTNSG